MRYKIIRGISYGLQYIHEECHIIHLDLKPENILMDDDMGPKIADFGMSRLFGHEQSRIITGSREGTLGYMAPEYLANGLISTKSDIFSLGVIIIEVITGHRNYPRICTRESFQHFIEDVVKNWRDWLERTVGCTSMKTCCQQIYTCMEIGLACVDPDPKKRPSAWDVIQKLNETECKNWSHVGQALQMFTMKSAYLLDDLTIARTGLSTSNTAKQVIAATYVDSMLGARSSTSNTESTAAVSCVPARSMIEIMAFGVAKILVRGSNMMKSDGAASGERKIGILAFEVANTIVSGSNLMKSLSEESMSHLNEVVLQSEGVRTLISEQYYQLLIIHQADIREQLRRFALDVIRLGKLCKDPVWRNLDLYFNKLELLYKSREYVILESELACSKQEAVSAMQYLLKRAQYTMELYKEMCVLDKFEQGKPTVVQSGITISSVKNQRIAVANLQKKSLWSKKMDDIVQKLVDIVLLIYLEINKVFLHTGEDHYVEAVGNLLGETLGSTGLALQYSKVILQINKLAMAFEKTDPSVLKSVPKEAKDALYQMLPPCIKLVFYRKSKPCLSIEKTSEEEVRAEMNIMLQWLVPIAESTRLYYNDGASEQAMNRMEDADDVQDFHCNIVRSRSNNSADSRVSKIETLFYANKERADSHILCLVKALHQLVCYERERQLANMRLDIELHRPRAFRTRPS